MCKFEKVVDGIYLLKIPFSNSWTGVILVTGDKNFLIDSGACEPETYIIPALKEMGMTLYDIDYLLNTHSHGDHIAGHSEIAKNKHIKVAVFEGGAETLENPAEKATKIRTRFPKHSPAPQSWLKGVKADILLKDGETIENRLMIIHTPGHDSDCVCWYDIPTKSIISGDSLQGNGTKLQGIGFYQNLVDYINSVSKLRKLEVENIIAGHNYDAMGDVIIGKENVHLALESCIDYTKKYDEFIRNILSREDDDLEKIAIDIIKNIGCGMPEYLFLALYTVTQHINSINGGN